MNVVIGASSGMGAAVARLLADRGPLLLADRDGDGADIVACDITRPEDVAAVVRSVDELGALVVTAGLSPSMAGGRDIYAVNLVALERVLRAFEPTLRPGSAAVCFASMAAHLMPLPPGVGSVLDEPSSPAFFDDLAAAGIDVDDPSTAYAYSKAGVLRLVRRLAGTWGTKGARLLSLSPGIIDTGMGRLEASNEPMMEAMVRGSAIGRQADPDEVAAVAVFLTSEQASFMTGTDVLVDGGAVAAMVPPTP
ncbi:MAG: oxidoreductase, family [Acidimicrobiales bacterium]|nr:oxidoreductase, family [Acidimicrobiales bacterium]